MPGDEFDIIGNYRRSTVHEVHIHTVYDAPAPARGTVIWDLFHLDGRRLVWGRKRVALRYGESAHQHTLDLTKPLKKFGRDELYLRLALDITLSTSSTGSGRAARVSEDTVFLTSPRFVHLQRARTAITVKMSDSKHASLTFFSPVFQHRFAFDLPGVSHRASDNYFELYPGEKKTVTVALSRACTATRLRKLLVYRSLVDTY